MKVKNIEEVFLIGETIGGEESEGVFIQITEADNQNRSIKAMVLEKGEFWGDQDHFGEGKCFFQGQELEFKENMQGDWILTNDLLPWFILSVLEDGDKKFEYYRKI